MPPTARSAVAALPEPVIATHGAVDCLIICASIIRPFVLVNDLDYAALDRVTNVNFYGRLNTSKAFLSRLLKRPGATARACRACVAICRCPNRPFTAR